MIRTAAALVVAFSMMAGCGGSSHQLTGSIQVVEQLGLGSENRIGQPCTGTGGYDDIAEGASVVVRDEANKVLATGTLKAGKIVALETCRFDFTVDNLPDAKFYQVEVSHRGAVTYSKSDLDSKGWKVALSLG